MRAARMKRIWVRFLAIVGSPWGIAVLAALSIGALLGIALGERRWPFFLGVLCGALLTAFGVRRLSSEEPRLTSQKEKGSSERAAPEVYDLQSDRSTDSQRWPM